MSRQRGRKLLILHEPEAMLLAAIVGEREAWLAFADLRQDRRNLASGIVIERHDGAERRRAGAGEAQSVVFGLGEGALVRQDDTALPRLQPHPCQQAGSSILGIVGAKRCS